ncbi:helix-turn-helix domain-containing protein [Allokutzneria multivorans]|uniref:Helix-turn-helix domain-containing protein n=1 Tax=Allokutzneria multivorans TaxID=1142134 RepID=A0ABP7R2Q2_9PSEU
MRFHDWIVEDAEGWTELSNSIAPMDHRFRARENWYAGLTAQESDTYSLLRWDQCSERMAYRTPAHVRRVPDADHYWIVVPQRGVYSMWHDGNPTRVAPGSVSINGLDEPFHMHVPVSQAYALRVPKNEIDHRVKTSARMRMLLDARTGIGRVTQDMIRSLHAERDRLTAQEFNAVCDRICELLCMMATGDTSTQPSHLAETAEVVRRYVRSYIGDADLPSAARALGWSPRQVRSILHRSGTTFRELRQEEAFRAARDMLADPARRALTIGEIARCTGLTPTWFSTAFKARYGETPRDFRHRRLSGG